MKSRNDREGRYCGCTPSPDGKGRRHVRSQVVDQVAAGAAARAVVARVVSEGEYRRQMALATRIMDEDKDTLRELARR
jgi:hypothetical protein